MRADLTIDGPGLVVRVHGDAPVLVADVRAEFKSVARALCSMPRTIRYVRSVSHSLRMTGLRVEIRFGGRTFLRLG